MQEFLRMANHILPPLSGGEYKVEVKQSLIDDKFKINDAVLGFAVAGNQVFIPQTEIYSTYPPKDSAGIFENCLPHVILHRKTLPWEKKIYEKKDPSPWVVLLLVSEYDGVRELTTKLKDALNPKEGIYIPEIDRKWTTEDEPCTVIDIPTKLFVKILPSKEDLPYLAHVRRVSLEDKVTDPDVKEGWLSCVVANRYPKRPNVSTEYVRHTVHLVSLEGFGKYIFEDNSKHPLRSREFVRMFSLTSFKFSTTCWPFDFPALAKGLKPGVLRPEGVKGNETLEKLTALGYCPVNHRLREGSRTVSWYRPPLIPQEPAGRILDSCQFSDSLLSYDPETGMFDVSYSAAWQLGRLLAIQDKELTRQIVSWRRDNKQKAIKQRNDTQIREAVWSVSAKSAGKSRKNTGINVTIKGEMIKAVNAAYKKGRRHKESDGKDEK